MTAARKINGYDHDFDHAPAPMDPERLAKLREMVVEGWLIPSHAGRQYVIELFAAHEWQAARAADLQRMNEAITGTTMGQAVEVIEALKARVAMLEERCIVEGEDVEREGATRSKLEAWLARHPKWTRVQGPPARASIWTRDGKRPVHVGDGPETIALTIEDLAVADLRSGWGLLAEVAAIDLPKLANN